MAYEFVKVSDVEVVENPSTNVNVIVEDGGDIKKVPKSAIGAQADWNETDETKPAFIMNKPENLGGYQYYYYYNYYMYKCADRKFEIDYSLNLSGGEGSVSKEQFENDYYAGPIMMKNVDLQDGVLVIGYDNEYDRIGFHDGTSTDTRNLKWNPST